MASFELPFAVQDGQVPLGNHHGDQRHSNALQNSAGGDGRFDATQIPMDLVAYWDHGDHGSTVAQPEKVDKEMATNLNGDTVVGSQAETDSDEPSGYDSGRSPPWDFEGRSRARHTPETAKAVGEGQHRGWPIPNPDLLACAGLGLAMTVIGPCLVGTFAILYKVIELYIGLGILLEQQQEQPPKRVPDSVVCAALSISVMMIGSFFLGGLIIAYKAMGWWLGPWKHGREVVGDREHE